MKIYLKNLEEGLTEIFQEHDRDSLAIAGLEEAGDHFHQPVRVNVFINKFGHQHLLKVQVHTMAHFYCDRCLEEFDRVIQDEFRLVYSDEKFLMTQEDIDSEQEIRFISTDTVEIDITGDIREALLLMIPIKSICSDTCRGLCPECGINLNLKTCDHHGVQMDPRWEALKKLKKS